MAGKALGIRLEPLIENRSYCFPASESCGSMP